VVVVGEGAVAVVAPVLLHERGVVVFDAGVDGRHDDAGAVVAHVPDLGRVDVLDAPCGVGGFDVGRDGLDDLVFGGLDDADDLVGGDDVGEEFGVAGDLDGGGGPEGLVVRAGRFEDGDDVGLGSRGEVLGGLDRGRSLVGLVVGAEGGLVVG